MDSLFHTGTPHEGMIPHSGRYPYGSGDNPAQRPRTWLEHIKQMEKEGLTEKEIAEMEGMSIRQYRSEKSLAKSEVRKSNREEAIRLSEAGFTNTEIAKKLDLPGESSVRNLLREDIHQRQGITRETVDRLEKEVNANDYVDIGLGAAELLGVSTTRLDNAVQYLKDEGYTVHNIQVEQAGIPGQYTTIKVLAKPGATKRDVYENADKIAIMNAEYIGDNGRSKLGLEPIKSISSKKLQIVYREDGGADKDGVIELRRGAKGLDLGKSRYAQVRIGVDGTHYLKGMAIYADDLPDGVDIRFNVSKSKADPKYAKSKLAVLKEMKKNPETGEIDQDNPFGASIKLGGQKGYLNIVREEGDWSTWSKTLASQMLSKQTVPLAKKQLGMEQTLRRQELSEIESLTNPVVKKYLLDQFADGCDKAAIHLKAAAMPRQSNSVILPLDTIKPNQIYAPGYENGESVVLIRFPHAGPFEIPQLTVNNNNREAKRLFGQAQDAVGIHHSVAEKLSGADFDGDTVLVIPNNSKKIRTDRPLKGLEGFDPKLAYPEVPGMKYMAKTGNQGTQIQMGIISNLITDMSLQKAPEEDLARAVRHSMVVIDAEKHKLNYKQSEIDNDIEGLKRKYQSNPDKPGKKKYGGATTLLSRAKSEVWVNQREEYHGNKGIDPKTGEKVYKYTGKLRYNRDGTVKTDKEGNPVYKQTKSTQMREASDARSLLSKNYTAMESTYADHANSMKALANQARKEILATPDPKRDPQAAKKYATEVESLKTKLNEAIKHAPYERKAQIFANHVAKQKQTDNPSMTKDELKKVRSQALGEARARLGGSKPAVTITPKEWEAIQANAISKTQLYSILRYADQDRVKEMAMPRESKGMSSSRIAVAKQMLGNGYTQQEVADRFNVSVTTLMKTMEG